MTERTELKRPFQCTWPGCSNSYARSEHLNRHKLNHEPVKIYRCEYCPKTFVRSDLLFRHKDRHARKTIGKSSPTRSGMKSLRPARSDSNSSREEGARPYSCMRSNGSPTSAEIPLSRSMPHPRPLLQSPFASTGNNSGARRSLEDLVSVDRSGLLPNPSALECNQSAMQLFSTNFDYRTLRCPSNSSTLPPIRDLHLPKSRTYSVESMLNGPPPFSSTTFSESVILE